MEEREIVARVLYNMRKVFLPILLKPAESTFFNIRDEMIDILDDINDYLVDSGDMKSSIITRFFNTLELFDDLREQLSFKDREYASDG